MWKPKDHSEDPSLAQSGLKHDMKERMLTFVVIAIWVAACLFAHAIYANAERALDSYGWLLHTHDTPVWMGGDWLAGEYRICQMPGSLWGILPKSAHLLCRSREKAPGVVWPPDFVNNLSLQEYISLFERYKSDWELTDHYFHVLPVKYWGRINRSDRSTFAWRCQRQARSLVCEAVN